MSKQKTLLIHLGTYLVGIITGLLITNYHILFSLIAIPTLIIFYRGAIQQERWNKFLKEKEEELNIKNNK